MTKEQLQGQIKVVTEQLELVTKSHDTLASKKQLETDLLSKEINLLGIKEREGKNLILHHERELGEIKDFYRQTQQELDVRTKENDHLVSLLEDQEQKIALYEEKEKSVGTEDMFLESEGETVLLQKPVYATLQISQSS